MGGGSGAGGAGEADGGGGGAGGAGAADGGGGGGAAALGEFAEFVADFRVSRALAVLKRVAAGAAAGAPEPEPEPGAEPAGGGGGGPGAQQQAPEGLWGRELPAIRWEAGPTEPMDSETVAVALAVAERACLAGGGGGGVSGAEWAVLRRARLCRGAAGIAAEQRVAAADALSRAPPRYQLPLLHDNVWLLKPSLNGGADSRGVELSHRGTTPSSF